MARSLETDEKSVRTIAKEGLVLFPLKMTSRQLMALHKQKRLERSKIVLNATEDLRRLVKSSFLTRNCSLLRPNSTHRTTEFWQRVRTVSLHP